MSTKNEEAVKELTIEELEQVAGGEATCTDGNGIKWAVGSRQKINGTEAVCTASGGWSPL